LISWRKKLDRLKELYKLYNEKFFDMLFINFFDIENTKNIDRKIEVLEECIEKNILITTFDDYDILLDNYPESDMWDLPLTQ
jgi:hypothetical protein